MIKADLHLHSDFSDGSDSVNELVQKIIDSGLSVFALTDHDTVAGCAVIKAFTPQNIRFIPAVELTSKVGSIKCHILGYNCDYQNQTLLDLIEKGKILRRNKLETRIAYLRDNYGIELNNEELSWLYSRRSVVKTHLANILVKRGLAEDNLSAMQKYLDGCKAGDARFTGKEAINAIISSGGIPVWAHPLGGEGEKHLSKDMFLQKLDEMLKVGIKGLECYYSRYTSEEADFLVDCALKNNLLISGGSDYHGSNKSNIQLGQLNNRNIYVSPSNLTILKYL